MALGHAPLDADRLLGVGQRVRVRTEAAETTGQAEEGGGQPAQELVRVPCGELAVDADRFLGGRHRVPEPPGLAQAHRQIAEGPGKTRAVRLRTPRDEFAEDAHGLLGVREGLAIVTEAGDAMAEGHEGRCQVREYRVGAGTDQGLLDPHRLPGGGHGPAPVVGFGATVCNGTQRTGHCRSMGSGRQPLQLLPEGQRLLDRAQRTVRITFRPEPRGEVTQRLGEIRRRVRPAPLHQPPQHPDPRRTRPRRVPRQPVRHIRVDRLPVAVHRSPLDVRDERGHHHLTGLGAPGPARSARQDANARWRSR